MKESQIKHSDKNQYAERLSALRSLMAEENVDAVLVPRSDEFQGEYVADYAARLEWLTGFSGSAGLAVVTTNKAVLLTDSRYTLQAEGEIDTGLFEICDSMDVKASVWIGERLNEGATVAYDAKLHTRKSILDLGKSLNKKAVSLKAHPENLVDRIWDDRPERPLANVSCFPENIAGKTISEKLEMIAEKIKEEGAQAFVFTLPDSIAWLFNIRGDDLPHLPVALSYAVLDRDAQATWFIDPEKVPEDVRKHLGNNVALHAWKNLEEGLEAMAAEAKGAGRPVAVDNARGAEYVPFVLERAGAQVVSIDDPVIEPKACKTESEQDAIRGVHIRDGVALVKFLQWVDETVSQGGETELSISNTLQEFRAEDETFIQDSFAAIVGFGPNGAIVHYRVNERTSLPVRGDGLLLVDSGGQYKYGTTDITRTIGIGQVSEEMKRHFTLVLRGHIAVATARFPVGTTGAQIDTLARKALWDHGLNYGHGTGHGVGCYLSVHEEAASISPRGSKPFKPGMLISNEPGYYQNGSHGIRVENLVFVKEFDDNKGSGESKQKMLCFETVSLAPIDTSLIIKDMLDDNEISWLNAYHEGVYETLSPHLDGKTQGWLQKATRSL